MLSFIYLPAAGCSGFMAMDTEAAKVNNTECNWMLNCIDVDNQMLMAAGRSTSTRIMYSLQSCSLASINIWLAKK